MDPNAVLDILHKSKRKRSSTALWLALFSFIILSFSVGLPNYPDDNLLQYMSSMLEENNPENVPDLLGFARHRARE